MQYQCSNDHPWHLYCPSITVFIKDGQPVRLNREFAALCDKYHYMFSYFGLADRVVPSNIDRRQFFQTLYAQRLEPEFRLIRETVCGCNMGTCVSPVSYTVSENLVTVGDLFRVLSFDQRDHEGYYTYPDSVMLFMSIERPLLCTVHEGRCCYNPDKRPCNMETPVEYINKECCLWFYSR